MLETQAPIAGSGRTEDGRAGARAFGAVGNDRGAMGQTMSDGADSEESLGTWDAGKSKRIVPCSTEGGRETDGVLHKAREGRSEGVETEGTQVERDGLAVS